MKKLFITLITSTLLVLAIPQAFAGGPKVTGGGDTIVAGAVIFSMSVNAVETSKGLKGSIQYSREANNGASELFVHATTSCMWISADGSEAFVAGPARVQSNPGNQTTNEWFFASIREGGTGSGDEVRAGFISMADAYDDRCVYGPEGSFPGYVEEGEFKIRP